MVCPGNSVPAEFFATTVTVAADPPTDNDVFVVVTVNVDPVIRIGIWLVFPLAVAVIVAVRDVALAPAENVTVTFPVASLVPLAALRNPVSAENVTGTPVTAAFDASVTVAVIVVVLLLSEATAVSEALRLMAAAVGVTTTGGVVVVVVEDVPEPPPPQAESSAKTAIRRNDEAARDEIIFNLCSCY